MTGLDSLIGSRSDPPVVEGTTVDELCHILGNERRRLVIEAIPPDGSTSIKALAEEVTEAEHGRRFSSRERKSVYVAIYQNHLPPLKEQGIAIGPKSSIEAGPNHAAAVDVISELEQRVDGGRA